MSTTKDPKEVEEMRNQLAEARKAARGVKVSAHNLRAVPKSPRLSQLTDEDMENYDSKHPKKADDTDKHVL
jgi:hypothetical protein